MLAQLTDEYEAAKREQLAAWAPVQQKLQAAACTATGEVMPTEEELQRLAWATRRRRLVEAQWEAVMALEERAAELGGASTAIQREAGDPSQAVRLERSAY